LGRRYQRKEGTWTSNRQGKESIRVWKKSSHTNSSKGSERWLFKESAEDKNPLARKKRKSSQPLPKPVPSEEGIRGSEKGGKGKWDQRKESDQKQKKEVLYSTLGKEATRKTIEKFHPSRKMRTNQGWKSPRKEIYQESFENRKGLRSRKAVEFRQNKEKGKKSEIFIKHLNKGMSVVLSPEHCGLGGKRQRRETNQKSQMARGKNNGFIERNLLGCVVEEDTPARKTKARPNIRSPVKTLD